MTSPADTAAQAQAALIEAVREALDVAARNCHTMNDGERSIAGRAALDALVAELDRLHRLLATYPVVGALNKAQTDLAEMRAELERVTRDRDAAAGVIAKQEVWIGRALVAEAELAAAAGREQRLRDVRDAAVAYVGREPLALLKRRDAGERHIGLMTNPKWLRLVEAVARAVLEEG